MAWSFNPFTGNLDLVGSGGGTVVFEGEVETFAELPETVGDPAVGASFLVRSSTGVWLVNRRQAGIWIRKNNTGVRATDWEYGGDYPVNSVNGQTGNVSLGSSDVAAEPIDYTVVTTATTLANGAKVAADTTAGAFTLTLPASPSNGDTVSILDYAGTFDTNNLTIARNGSNIESLAENMDCNIEDAAFSLVFVGSTVGWKVVPYFGSVTDLTGYATTAQLTDTQIFTANGTWTKPAGAKLVHYLLIGGGGGGGGGRRSDASTAAFGGGGGSGAGVSIGWLNADFLGSTETVIIGAGGNGGGARTASDTNGQSGVAGGNTSFGSFLEARGGTAGAGGTTTAGTRGAPSAARGAFYGGTQDSSAGGGSGSPETTGGIGEVRMSMPSGGGGGAGKSAAGAYGTGGAGASIGLTGTGVRTGISATANAAGTDGTGFFYYGLGGSGGSPNSANGAANKGGAGGNYGAGGGGGSGSLNAAGGDNSGGAGANGVVVITTYR
jgi:hypothetical protein